MIGDFLRRKNHGTASPVETAARSRPLTQPFPAGVSCGAGCPWTRGYRCAYQDLAGNRCGWWCQDHSVVLNGRTWCQRHANSVKRLDAMDGSIFEIRRLPGIKDRSPNLAAMLVDELDDEVTAHLKSSFGHKGGVQVVTDDNIRTSMVPKGRVELTPDGPVVLSEGSHVAWARGWGVYNETGYLARVILQVIASEPPVVHLYVNGSAVLSRVPDWIANRGTGADEAEDHARFKRVVQEAIRDAIRVEDRESDPG